MRKINLVNNEYYHIYNRGTDKRDVFIDDKDFARFIWSMREFNNSEVIGGFYRNFLIHKTGRGCEGLASKLEAKPSHPLVEFVAYCLNKNHYHFILKQLIDDGISRFMQRLSTSYTMSFNQKYKRSGSLFQGPFKAKHINSREYLTWLSGYVHGNPEIHKIAKAESYKWSSYQDYLGLRDGTLCNQEIIKNEFNNNLKDYKNFVDTVIDDSQDRKKSIADYLDGLE